VRLAPARAVTYYYRGRICQDMGDPGAAREAFQKALSLSADFEGARDARERLARLK
jgi:hypothetical protein